MPEAQRHTIRRQFLEVEIDGDEREGASLHRALPDLCTRLLAPAIGQVLERYASAETILTIERLDIDAGNVSLDELSRKLPGLVTGALETELSRISREGHAIMPPLLMTGSTARLRTVQEKLIEAFLFFLENGTLPWSVSIVSHAGLESEVAKALKEVSPAGSLPVNVKSALFETLLSPLARQRLVRQFSPAFIRSIPDLFSVEEVTLLSRLLRAPGLEQATGSLAEARQRLLLDEALTLIVSGTRLTETSLLSVLQSRYTVTSELKTRPEKVSDSLQSGDTRHETQPPPEAGDAAKRQTDAPLKNASDLQDSGSEPLAGSTRNDGCKESVAEIGDESVTNDQPTRTEQDGSSGEACHRDVQGAAGRQDAQSETRPDSRRLTTAGSAGQLSGSSRENGGGKLRSAIGDHAVTDKDASRTEPDDTVKPGSAPRQRDSASGEEQEQPSGNRARAIIRKSFSGQEHPDKTAGLYIDHAGLVLLHPFLPQFFRGIGIAEGEKLVIPNRAQYLLHFLATGIWSAPEYELPVMKVLCGLTLEYIAEPEEPLLQEDDEEVTALLSAVIHHWDALKNTSPDGLREAFLKRSGKLSFSSGEWWLQIESKGYDILLDQLPWGISMIRLPWMPEMLRVEWFS